MSLTFVGTNVPPAPAVGSVRYDTDSNEVQVWDGMGWVAVNATNMINEKKLVCEDLKFGDLWFYKVVTEGYDFDEMNEWCNQTFGPPRTGPDPYNKYKWFISGGEFYFHEEKHRAWFVLKWSSGETILP